MSEGNGTGTFVGPGFGTVQLAGAAGASVGPPPVVSRRATMRRSLPSIYHDAENDPSIYHVKGDRRPFALRFVEALECVLDPIEAVLDTLPEHFSPDYATRPMIDMLAAWLGIEIDVELDAPPDAPVERRQAAELQARREAVRMAAELGRRRGTVRGLELALRLSFPGVPMRVEDVGSVHWSKDGARAKAEPPSFVVYVDTPIAEERKVAVARCIERHKPVQVSYRLRIKAPKASQ
jgi:phage tail-like protein